MEPSLHVNEWLAAQTSYGQRWGWPGFCFLLIALEGPHAGHGGFTLVPVLLDLSQEGSVDPGRPTTSWFCFVFLG